ncbi:MAG TPA: MBL fold metallo-hydrolase [Anaerolineales bacterium]|jgi:glyoxylase-like metal-dependent hydrolase (beta-lactamase superfamily II)
MNILNVGYDSANYYLLEPEKTGLLVDTGWPGSLPRFAATLKRKGLGLQQVRYLLCTHYHPDHAGLAQELKAQGVRLIVLDRQLSGLSDLGRFMKPANHFQEISPQGNLQLTAAESRAFLRSLGLAGEIIYTPGHSDDSVSLLLDEGLAFTGDALTPTQVPASQDQVEKIWVALRSHGVKTVFPGHGPLIELC